MYYIVYGLLYLISLLPFGILYLLSDAAYVLLYYVFKYRRKIVRQNIAVAFPEKNDAERKKIEKQFYKNFADTFIETIKMLSMRRQLLDKRCTVDFSASRNIIAKGKNIHYFSGHQMNWEYAASAVSKSISIPLVGVYMPIANKTMNKLFYKIRNKPNTILVSATAFKTQAHKAFQTQYALGLIADQAPAAPAFGYWLNFFDKPCAFQIGPDKGAIIKNAAVVFVSITRIKRGYYHVQDYVVTENAAECKAGELTNLYRDFLEEAIRKSPDGYLWSHRRWKWEYQSDYKSKWIDKRAEAPAL